MSPKKEPLTLFTICSNSLTFKIIDICHKYCKRVLQILQVQRENVTCPEELLPMKRYFLDNLPNHLFDCLCNETLLCLSAKIGRMSAREYENVLKVILSLFVHSNMRIFYPKDNHGMTFIPSPVPDIDYFWISMLCSSKKLVVLSLYKVCTDDILEVVGTNCLLLEVIDITSKTSCFKRNKLLNVRGSELQYFISDIGLSHLSNCKRLREVHMNNLSVNHHARRMVTQEGIVKLVRALPALTYISYKAMGTIVNELNSDENACALSLMHVEEDNCKLEHIRSLSNLCKNLKSLTLTKKNVSRFLVSNEVEESIMLELCASDFKLGQLTVRFWPYSENLFKFIKLKGYHLHTLRLVFFVRCGFFSSNELNLIGQCCPNLESLHLDPISKHDSDFTNVCSANKYFINLTSLYFRGGNWRPEVCFSMCVRNATKLTTLYIIRDVLSGVVLDNHFLNVLKYNSLPELRVLHLGRGLFVSKNVLYRFIDCCKNLQSITMSNDCVDASAQSELRSFVFRNNLNLELNFNDSIRMFELEGH